MSFGYFKISANLNFTTQLIYTLNRTSRPSISWTFNTYNAQRPLLSFLNNSGDFLLWLILCFKLVALFYSWLKLSNFKNDERCNIL